MSLDQIIRDAYFNQLTYNFKYHPRGTFMVEAILAGQLTAQEIAEQLDVAAWYHWQHLRTLIHKAEVDQKGNITLKVRHHEMQ